MKSKKCNLVVVAHPDDETLFFGGLIQMHRRYPWEVVCATDGNADGFGAQRKLQFERACRTLGVKKTHWLGFPDVYENRLNLTELCSQLKEFTHAQDVFTHNSLGEYGHPHHQDVCAATHEAFAKHQNVFSTAYNAYPEKIFRLTPRAYQNKTKVLTKIYSSETRRFTHLLPATWTEGFVRVSSREARALYSYLASGAPLAAKDLKVFRWYLPYLDGEALRKMPRPF